MNLQRIFNIAMADIQLKYMEMENGEIQSQDGRDNLINSGEDALAGTGIVESQSGSENPGTGTGNQPAPTSGV